MNSCCPPKKKTLSELYIEVDIFIDICIFRLGLLQRFCFVKKVIASRFNNFQAPGNRHDRKSAWCDGPDLLGFKEGIDEFKVSGYV